MTFLDLIFELALWARNNFTWIGPFALWIALTALTLKQIRENKSEGKLKRKNNEPLPFQDCPDDYDYPY